MPFVEILNTKIGAVLAHRFDTAQTMILKLTGMPMNVKEIEALHPFINQSTVFIDIGANIGTFSLCFAPIARKVIAFEAQRFFANMLAGSVALNGFKNVWVHNVALSDRTGYIPIPQFDQHKPLAFGSVEFGKTQIESIGQVRQPDDINDMVTTYCLDELVAVPDSGNPGYPEIDKVDVIKIDVEGMELEVLAGAKGVIAMHRPVMLIEYLKCGKEALQKWAAENDYNTQDLGMDYLMVPR